MKTLYRIGKLFVDEYIRSFDKAPKKVILDADDTNADTYGAQQLTLFNLHYNSHCYMPVLIIDGVTGKLLLPILRPGRRNKSLNVARIMQRIVEYLHSHWPNTVIELRGDSHFASHGMSCNAYRANYFRLFIYSAAFVLAHNMKHTLFMGTQVESFTMDSLIKRIMLSAVFIEQKKTFIKVSFSPHHRHLEDITIAFSRMAA